MLSKAQRNRSQQPRHSTAERSVRNFNHQQALHQIRPLSTAPAALEKRTVIITGGTGGIGIAAAKIMASDHRVVISSENKPRLDAVKAELASSGVQVETTLCDVTQRNTVREMFCKWNSDGHVRAVLHSAGVSPQMGDSAFITRINAVGTVHITEAFLESAAQGDALVNVASVAAYMFPSFLSPKRAFPLAMTDLTKFERRLTSASRFLPDQMRRGLAYSNSKAFVVWYTKKMAAAFGARGARVVSVSPGLIDTPMGTLESKHGGNTLLNYAAIKRMGKPEEIAEVLAFSASEKAGYLTGSDILVDGGTMAGYDFKGIFHQAQQK